MIESRSKLFTMIDSAANVFGLGKLWLIYLRKIPFGLGLRQVLRPRRQSNLSPSCQFSIRLGANLSKPQSKNYVPLR